MDTKALKQKILDLAIHGKLVPQDPNDEPAKELLSRTIRKRKELEEKGIIRKEKDTNITVDNPPFEIPTSWVWCRLGTLALYKKGPFGSSLTKSMFVPKSSNSYKVYEQQNAIQKNWHLGHYYISREKFLTLKGFSVQPNDIIVSCAGTIGETYVLPKDIEKGIINQALMLIRLFDPEIQYFYLIYFDYILKKQASSASKGTAIKNIPPFAVLKNFYVPLPPLEEQKRIVARINELFSIIDKIEESKASIYESLNKAKGKILDMAINGELIKPTTEWKESKLKDVFLPMKSSKPKGSTFKYIDIKSINNKSNVIEKISQIPASKAPSRASRFTEKGDTLFSMVRPYLRNIAMVYENDCIASSGFFVCRPSNLIDSKFCYYFMLAPSTVNGLNAYIKGDNSPSINKAQIENWLIKLPSIKEQRDIVSKIEVLFSLINTIKVNLQ